MCFTTVHRYLCSFRATEPFKARCKHRTYGRLANGQNCRVSRPRFAVHDSYIYPGRSGTGSEPVHL
jgi:hypothetical protein